MVNWLGKEEVMENSSEKKMGRRKTSSSTSSSSTTTTHTHTDSGSGSGSDISQLSDDLLQTILCRLPATSFAAAASVNRTWNDLCRRILSRPLLSSALSLNPSVQAALNEVIHKVLSKPIRPHFAIAVLRRSDFMPTTLQFVKQKLGSNIPIIVSCASGIIGRDAITDQFHEVQWEEDDDRPTTRSSCNGVLLTVGYVPGLKVDAIPLLQHGQMGPPMGKKFIMDIRDFSTSVSGSSAPLGIVLFGGACADTHIQNIVEKLAYATNLETAIVGDKRGEFTYRSPDHSRNINEDEAYRANAVALVFARDRNNIAGSGQIKFHVEMSDGLSPIGPRYKAISVRRFGRVTMLTATREGQREILDGERILDEIYEELEDHPDLYIGVAKRRKYAIGSEKSKLMTFMSFHGVSGGDEESLHVESGGIKMGDYFQFYYSHPPTAFLSCCKVASRLRRLNLGHDPNNCDEMRGTVASTDKTEVIGGFIFSCCARGQSFFGHADVDSSPFLSNFPGVSLSGQFCGGEIGICSLTNSSREDGEKESSALCCCHVYSTLYLVMLYTP